MKLPTASKNILFSAKHFKNRISDLLCKTNAINSKDIIHEQLRKRQKVYTMYRVAVF